MALAPTCGAGRLWSASCSSLSMISRQLARDLCCYDIAVGLCLAKGSYPRQSTARARGMIRA